ncbi:NADP-dependent isocitrate dehydrogenase, partial [Myxococcota bacterium]|nr:NADP-dependent isocitrate dehydrogenase [Myxococcota bacterium]
MEHGKIIYTFTDEAPALATHSLLPIIQTFAGACGVDVETRDISLAGRILARFPEYLTEDQQIGDALEELGELAKTPQANIIKLPNISASIPQMKAAISELQSRGYRLPDYPDDPSSPEEIEIKNHYDRIKGSAVNPVLREGNSDRRAPAAVKQYAQKHPHPMGPWSPNSKTHVSHMTEGDFRSNEKSITVAADDTFRIEHVDPNGAVTILKEAVPVLKDEIIDGTFMSKKSLVAFLNSQIEDAKAQGVLFSIHLKATMMKVSDPIIFGHAVRVFFSTLFEKHRDLFEKLGVNANDGLGSLKAAIQALPEAERQKIEAEIQACYAHRPSLAMVDSDRGITNLHVPSDIIVDASMPAMIRSSGQMWNAEGVQQDTKAVIPDGSYAGIYQAAIDSCREHGAFDPTQMGTVPNVGLMAQKAEEYGSHDKTFEIATDGIVRVLDGNGQPLIQHSVEAGDIW